MTSETPSRVLVVTAHPDDVDFGAGGSVATWTDAGVDVVYCVVTDGDAGGSDPTVERAKMAAVRRAEQTAAAAIVGVEELHWLGYPDGRVEVSLDLRHDIARIIRRVRPDRVVCQSPERQVAHVFASHPDHLAVGEATVCAVYPDARNPFAFPELAAEGWEAHTAGELWVMTTGEAADTWVDVTEAFPRKIAALRAHVSQETDRSGQLEDRVRSWLTSAAKAAGLPEGRLAEGYRRVETA